MMNELMEMRQCDSCSMVVLHKGKDIRPLYHLFSSESELLFQLKVVAKAVGTTATKAMTEDGVVEVFADAMSQQAAHFITTNK